MNVGILTFHMAHNCGAMLQAYALSKSIADLFSCECRIIDYRLPEIYSKYEAMLQMDPVEPKRLKFDWYMKTVLPLTATVSSLSEIKDFDLYIIGSDQIWNAEITQGYKDEYFGKCFPPGSYCISYAASTGTRIRDAKRFAARLKRFRYVSVRESWLQKELAPYFPRGVAWCLDPVLLLEREQWGALPETPDRRRYILLYSFDMDEDEYLYLELWAGRHGLEIVELITHERVKRRGILYDGDYGPEEWINYVKNAAYVYTDSYHCALFAILFDRKLRLLTHGRGRNERIDDILNRLMLLPDEDGFYTVTKQTAQHLAEGRKVSFHYLKKAVDLVEHEKAKF